jgi:hypothetical protein
MMLASFASFAMALAALATVTHAQSSSTNSTWGVHGSGITLINTEISQVGLCRPQPAAAG